MLPYHQQLRKIITTSIDQIEAVPDRDFDFKADPATWSKKEILGHLIDSAYNNHQRFLKAPAQPDLVFTGYDQNEWVIRNNYQNRDKAEVLNTWIVVNRHLSNLLEGLPTPLLVRKTPKHNFHKICMNLLEDKQPATLSYLIWDYLFHLEHHLSQIIPDYRKMGGGFSE